MSLGWLTQSSLTPRKPQKISVSSHGMEKLKQLQNQYKKTLATEERSSDNQGEARKMNRPIRKEKNVTGSYPGSGQLSDHASSNHYGRNHWDSKKVSSKRNQTTAIQHPTPSAATIHQRLTEKTTFYQRLDQLKKNHKDMLVDFEGKGKSEFNQYHQQEQPNSLDEEGSSVEVTANNSRKSKDPFRTQPTNKSHRQTFFMNLLHSLNQHTSIKSYDSEEDFIAHLRRNDTQSANISHDSRERALWEREQMQEILRKVAQEEEEVERKNNHNDISKTGTTINIGTMSISSKLKVLQVYDKKLTVKEKEALNDFLRETEQERLKLQQRRDRKTKENQRRLQEMRRLNIIDGDLQD